MVAFDLQRDVLDLTEKSLSRILCENDKETNGQFIEEKNHVRYLQGYLGEAGLQAKFVVVEKNYINKDYLIDYSTYYSTCFKEYKKTGYRLHFFSSDLVLKDFKSHFFDVIVGKDQ